jgi:hypothetical protein
MLKSIGYQKSKKVTLGNYVDKVEVVREVNRQELDLESTAIEIPTIRDFFIS